MINYILILVLSSAVTCHKVLPCISIPLHTSNRVSLCHLNLRQQRNIRGLFNYEVLNKQPGGIIIIIILIIIIIIVIIIIIIIIIIVIIIIIIIIIRIINNNRI